MKPSKFYVSIQRSVKVAEFQYHKVELGVQFDVEPKDSGLNTLINMARDYISDKVDVLLKEELDKRDRELKKIASQI